MIASLGAYIGSDVIGRTPLRRIGEPGEAVFLVAEAGAFLTGQSILIDGGMSIGAAR